MEQGDKTILVVDELKKAELTINAFRSADFSYPIQIAQSGEAALDYLHRRGAYGDRARFPFPHLVLLETALSGMSGWDVLKSIYEQRRFKTLPVIVFTETHSQGDEKRAKELGAFAYERKPSEFDKLVQVVTKIGSFWLLAPLPPPESES